MKESEYSAEVKAYLAGILGGYDVNSHVNLQHSVIFAENAKLWPEGLLALPRQKVYAYEVDVLVSRKGLPLVGIELKCGQGGGYSTHDVLTYSAKAARHKELYPYLRYGMAVGSAKSIGRKFFFTNRALDFVVATLGDGGLRRLADVIEHQAKLAENAIKILDRVVSPRVLSWQNGNPWEWAHSTGEEEPDDAD